MNKRYLLISKSEFIFGIDTELFYTLEEAENTAKNKKYFETTIIDLEDKNIKWQGDK
ncbi:hypothetical protein [Spiroplasma sp. ChiS]|uniref:hypothetical protein n=1 Tax=Spiroplasma sp. ChiS TaxID=2099885 RepID=UPI0013923F7E|nr:hypothetical protein [Spiroplasma sp. ChiS]